LVLLKMIRRLLWAQVLSTAEGSILDHESSLDLVIDLVQQANEEREKEAGFARAIEHVEAKWNTHAACATYVTGLYLTTQDMAAVEPMYHVSLAR
jgi:hypothetical protein